MLLESTAGDSHPGSRHLQDLVAAAGTGVYKAGGKPTAYTVSDICDGLGRGSSLLLTLSYLFLQLLDAVS
jgi:dihydroxy-acid dehydratase